MGRVLILRVAVELLEIGLGGSDFVSFSSWPA